MRYTGRYSSVEVEENEYDVDHVINDVCEQVKTIVLQADLGNIVNEMPSNRNKIIIAAIQELLHLTKP